MAARTGCSMHCMRAVRCRCSSWTTSEPDALAAALAARPALVWIETPSNPLLRIVDIERRRDACQGGRRDRGRRQHVPVAGLAAADSARRRSRRAFDDQVPERAQRRRRRRRDRGHAASCTSRSRGGRNCIGVTGAPFDSYLTLRGLRTLHARMRAHGENAQRIVEVLARHPAVAKVYFPGLARRTRGTRRHAHSSRDSARW